MFRAMDHSHGVHTPVGWPRVLAERLLERGERMEWSTVFMTEFDHLPGREDLGHYLRLSDVPDVVFVALGTRYANLAVLPETPAMLRLREDIGRRLGRHAITGYRLQRPLMRVFGRPAAPYGGAAGLERFLTAVRDEWPDVPVALITPPPRLVRWRCSGRSRPASWRTPARRAAARAWSASTSRACSATTRACAPPTATT